MVKIGDIAKATGYSVTTVSKAFNNYTDISEKARTKIRKAADEMGYIPNAQARGLVMKRSFTIGVILDELLGLGLTHPFFSGVIQAFRIAVEAEGYSMILISNNIGNSKIESYLNHCNQRNVDGVFILCTNKDDKSIQELIHSKIPTVLFDIPDDTAHVVISDHYQGAYDAIEYLVSLGHVRIGHIYGSELTLAGADRKKGYLDAMEANDLIVNEAYVASGGYFDFKYGKQAMLGIIKSEEILPTAMFIASDIMALGAIQACHEEGIKVPEDISFIGFDNVRFLDWITPGLTTVAQDYDALAKACCKMLIQAIGDSDMQVAHEVIPTHIIERNSCTFIK